MEAKGLTISGAVGVVALISAGVTAYNYFQSDDEAFAQQVQNEQEHLRIASDTERGRLENELKLVSLEIDWFVNRQDKGEELSERDRDRLEYLRNVRLNLEERLKDLASAAAKTG